MIFPEPVTLNLFFALEFVLTFGLTDYIYFYTLLAFRTGGNLWSLVGNPAGAGNGPQNYDKKLKIVRDLINFRVIAYFALYD